ncbi:MULTISPECIES: ATP-binding cassette domain-containing protein [Bradyrhizobium]|jgi:osmoprotectant transport system ATP-binding protein|uniref:ATP-binding cassette domain-containing protein n=1 Tax=Bradyrhizobium TaxID=374 RepID=UPI0004BB6D04|nr:MULTISPECIES: ATP-binding cassette domain-containing protein [Bradyrhizobium]MCS3446503.1 osmoprotectant transport system ATP-binding protein [Bradyrhizobium elkanii]MCS3562363.1 osmoprotectant transport system ATP-binding protein [Bradyrhizobium elkanii]MCW2147799.1 osmoprotectant transport system ATP-binding protein [Bradyrhizobium elkanii]MCW2353117.1 osmoprotectant transport system ATP-binding protein [Bradyrhizobium elkanii]MCW2371525.1 osmoprotectant transport system ATP-binding prote
MTASPISNPSASVPYIKIDAVSKSYDGGRNVAVSNVSLDVHQGSLVALVGGSGSGKTTLLKTINRLVDPDVGEVRIDGVPVSEAEPPMLRRSIGYVFQGIGLFPHMRVADNIAVTLRLRGWQAKAIEARVAEMLDMVDLPQDYASRFPHMLSGGQRQRIGVARAIAARPRIVLMDEPLGALDPVTRDSLGSSYRELHDRFGMTTLMVTHDIQEAALMADRIVVMKNGRILADDTPHALMMGSGSDDPDVTALMEVPRRQAERIAALATKNGPVRA